MFWPFSPFKIWFLATTLAKVAGILSDRMPDFLKVCVDQKYVYLHCWWLSVEYVNWLYSVFDHSKSIRKLSEQYDRRDLGYQAH